MKKTFFLIFHLPRPKGTYLSVSDIVPVTFTKNHWSLLPTLPTVQIWLKHRAQYSRMQATVGRQQCREPCEIRPGTEDRLAHELPCTLTEAGTPFMVVQYSDSYWNIGILLEVTSLVLKDSCALLHSHIFFIYVLSKENKT
jgi:hypothetical protein